MFADDTKIFLKGNVEFQNDLDKLKELSERWKMVFNAIKCNLSDIITLKYNKLARG